MQSHSDLIEQFGGVRPLAEAIGVDPKLAIHWPRRRIPSKYWHRVIESAAVKGISVTPRDLERWPAATGAEVV